MWRRRFVYLLGSVSRGRRGGFTSIAIAAVCLASPVAAADDAPRRPLGEAFTLQAAECLELTTLAPAVGRWLGRDEIDRRISVVVRREDGAVVYELQRDDVLVGQRRVTNLPEACSELTTALALSIAVAIEATFFGPENEQAAAPENAPSPVPSSTSIPVSRPPRPDPRPDPPPRPAHAPPRQRHAAAAPHQASLRAETGVLLTTLPGARPLLGAGIDVAWSRHLETRTTLLATTAARSPLGSGEVETRLFAARADVCAASPIWRLELRACVGLGWGLVESRGIGFLDRRSPSQPWLGLPLRGEVRIPLERSGAKLAWGVLAAADLVATLRRAQIGVVGQWDAPRPSADRRTTVLTLPVLGGAASVGLYVEL